MAIFKKTLKPTFALAVLLALLLAVGCNGFFTDPILTSITVGPASPSVPVGGSLQMTATGNYDDSSTKTIPSASVSWSSSDTNIATVSSSGVLTGVSAGTATITATSGTISGTTQVTVTNGTLVSITVTPASAILSSSLTQTQQFTATGTFSSGQTSTSVNVTWSSSAPNVVSISSSGLATVAAGVSISQQVTITASATTSSDTVQGSAVVNVVP